MMERMHFRRLKTLKLNNISEMFLLKNLLYIKSLLKSGCISNEEFLDCFRANVLGSCEDENIYWDDIVINRGGIFLFSFPTLVQKFSGEKEKQKLYLFPKHLMLLWINLILVKLFQNGIGL